MKIYGVAILAACYLVGQIIGEYLGLLLGIEGNVGGVGFGMLLLVLIHDKFKSKEGFQMDTQQGILFWSSMYIPIVIAMAATQNVKAALSGGWVAILAGVVATGVGFVLIPMIVKVFTSRN